MVIFFDDFQLYFNNKNTDKYKIFHLDMVRSGMISRLGMSFGMMGMRMSSASVLDISDVSTIGVIHMVSHSLKATIRKQNVVFAIGGVPISSFVVAKISSSVVIMDFVFVGVVNGYIVVRGVMGGVGVVGSRSVGFGLGREGKNGKYSESL